ncbi:MAG TPA: 3-methyl-2-oxobutanoate dehydrogenase subunit beta [Syntrophomonas sp.]|jgi:2-oxoglutarate ferredoxin oxidoreductase subunit alpha|nr:3-methyl-2-oxobutanoate dehydrogenase subunit beta [Syntrophomonas sp.]
MQRVLMKGNEAIAEGAIRAGCKGFFGYPITPSSEIAEYMARKMPTIGGIFVQAESELAAINMVYGGASTGFRVMTASSGPGISLKQEGISFLAEGELPCLIVDISRGGPGLGGIQPSQADYFQATRGGGHGDYFIIVLAPSSAQEMMDLTMLAFDLADGYRIPVMLLAEGTLGNLIEPVVLRDPVTEFIEKPWAITGCKGRQPNIVNTLHLPVETLQKRNQHLNDKYQSIKANEVRYEEYLSGDADLIVVAYGIMARIVKKAVWNARQEGVKTGLIRPITLWPYPYEAIAALSKTCTAMVSVEISSSGQMIQDIQLAAQGRVPVHFIGEIGRTPNPEEITQQLLLIAEREGLK